MVQIEQIDNRSSNPAAILGEDLLDPAIRASLPIAESPTTSGEDTLRIALFNEVMRLRQAIPAAQDIAHSMRNPLTSIKGYAELIQHSIRTNEFNPLIIEKYLGVIIRQTDRANKILTSALAVFDTLKPDEPVVVSMAQILQNAAERNLDLMQAHRIKLSLTLPNEELVFVDPEKIGRAIDTFFSNSEKALKGRRNKCICIWCEKMTSSEIAAYFSDNGRGMKEELLLRCFEDGVSESGSSGKGLGMAKKNIEGSKGRLLEPVSQLGKGTTMCFVLPLYKSQS